MINTLRLKLKQGIVLIALMLTSFFAYSQAGTSVTLTVQNAVQISPNVFEYDVMFTNTGTTSIKLRGYSWGINHSNALANGGTITHSYISRDASLSSLPSVSQGYTAASFHLRGTTVNATAGNEVQLTAGVPVRLATMRVTTSATSFPTDFHPWQPVSPLLPIQTITAAGKTQCIATCIVTPPNSSYAINGAGNNPIAGTLQLLTGVLNTPCFYLNPTSSFLSSVTSITPIVCFGQSNGAAQITLSQLGSGAPEGIVGTYSVNGAAGLAYTGNPFTVSNLASGTDTIIVTTSYGCKDTVTALITAPTVPLTSSFTASGCDSYTLPWSTVVNASGVYTNTYIATNTCDSVVTANITINSSTINTPSSAVACNTYTWPVNGQSYTASGTYTATFLNANGCDSSHTLNLTINNSTSSTTSVSIAGSYTWAANGITYTTSGTYTSTFTNTVGCDSISTLQLTINGAAFSLSVQQVSPITCFGSNNGSAQGVITGPGAITFNIDGGLFTNTTGLFTGLMPGTHTICATDGLFTLCQPITFIEPSAVALSASNTAILCFGGTSVITASGAGGTGTKVITVNGLPLASSYSAGTYTVTATDSNSCSTTTVLNITEPSALSSTTSVTNCGSYTWVANTTTYTGSGTYTATVLSTTNCDSILTLNLTVLPISVNAPTTVSSCVSYTWSVNGTTYTTSGIKTATYTNAAGCDSSYTLNLTINPVTTVTSNVSAPNIYVWAVNGQTYTNSGIYTVTTLNGNGCTQTNILDLTINLVSFTMSVILDQPISCFGNNDGSIQAIAVGTGPFTFILDGGASVNNTGFFNNLGPGSHVVCALAGLAIACDTIVLIEPAPLAATFFIDSMVSCLGNDGMMTINITGGTNILQGYLTWWTNSAGDTLNDILLDNFALFMDSIPVGAYTVVIEDDRGCFLTTVGNMVAAPPIVVNATFPPIVCFGGTTTLTPSGVGGVSYPPLYNSTLTYQINGAPVAASYGPGTYTVTATDYKGCTATTVVTITAPLVPITTAINVSSCDTYFWAANSTTYTNSGVYTATLIATNTCDSIVTMTLTINNSSVNTPTSLTECNSYTWSANSLTYTNSGIYSASFLNTSNCDSTVILNLTINYSTINAPTNASSCTPYTWPVNGGIYTSSGTYTATYLNVLGCDSSYTLNLTINTASVNNPVLVTACNSYTWSANSTNYTLSGIYTSSFSNANGCDSTVTLNLTINNSSVNTPQSATDCNSYTWSVNSTTYSTSGTYTSSFTNSVGCDSSATLILTINNSDIHPTQTISSCNTYTWPVNGLIYTQSGSYTATYLNASGCDSSYALSLTINSSSVNNPTNVTACGAYTWLVNGVSYTTSGTYTATYLNLTGCDSNQTLNLTISGSNDIANTTAGNASSVAGSQCQSQNQIDGSTVSYFDTSCKIIATVQDASGGNVLGNVNSCVIVTAAVPIYNMQPYFARYYTINASAGPANLTLYLTQDDFNDYNANAGIYPQIPVPAVPVNGSTATLCISQVPQTTLPGAPGANTTVHVVTAVWNAAAARWEVNFPVVGFGGFYFHACTGVPLPATVSKFTGFKANTKDVLEWTTSSEQNNAYFNLEHGTDGANFSLLAKVNSQAIGGNSNTILNYTSENLYPSIGHNYYRLQQVDLNGTTSYESQVVDLIWLSDGNSVIIYPNPATDILNVDLFTAKSANIVVKILDMSGRTVKQVSTKSHDGMNNITISLSELASGLYTVQILENNKLSFVEKVRKSD